MQTPVEPLILVRTVQAPAQEVSRLGPIPG